MHLSIIYFKIQNINMLPSKKKINRDVKSTLYSKRTVKTKNDEPYPTLYLKNNINSSIAPHNRLSQRQQNQISTQLIYRKHKPNLQLVNISRNSRAQVPQRNSQMVQKENYALLSKMFTIRKNKMHPITDRCYDKLTGKIIRNKTITSEANRKYQISKNDLNFNIMNINQRKNNRKNTEKNEKIFNQKNRYQKSITQKQQNEHYLYESYSLKGSKVHNQDYIKCGDNIWVLCDGHGQFGHEVSEYVSQIIYQLLREAKNNKNLSKKKISEIFSQTEDILESSHIDIILSGSTCTIVVKQGDTIYSANVGDSPAVVFTSQNQRLKFFDIYTEHKPCDINQKKRIQFYGGSVRRHPLKVNIDQSPLRLWGTNQDNWGPGLAVSRAFGDKMAQKYGLICQPTVTQFEYKPEYKNIIIGSDGLFDKLSCKQIESILSKQKNIFRLQDMNLCESIVNTARKRWINYSDDVSGVLIYL